MPIVTCPKCKTEYDGLYTHTCLVVGADEKEIKVKESDEKKWAKKSALAKFFGYPPGLPYPLKILSRSFILGVIGGFSAIILGLFTEFDATYRGEIVAGPLYIKFFLLSMGLQMFVFSLVMSYGIARTKKWALYISAVLLALAMLSTIVAREFVFQTIVMLFVVLTLWAYRKEFKHATTKADWIILTFVTLTFMLDIFARLFLYARI